MIRKLHYYFSIVCMPHLDSNILSNIYYATIGSEILSILLQIIFLYHLEYLITLSSRLFKKYNNRESGFHLPKKSFYLL